MTSRTEADEMKVRLVYLFLFQLPLWDKIYRGSDNSCCITGQNNIHLDTFGPKSTSFLIEQWLHLNRIEQNRTHIHVTVELIFYLKKSAISDELFDKVLYFQVENHISFLSDHAKFNVKLYAKFIRINIENTYTLHDLPSSW